MNLRTSIVIVSFCTRDLLRNCLASIRSHTISGLEIIVVDNHSCDESPQMVRTEFPEIQLIENVDNVGFARANNRGIQRARGKYLLLLNSDTVVRGRAIEDMADFLDNHSRAGGVTCRLLNADGTIQACVSARPDPLMVFLRLAGASRLFRDDRSRRRLRRYASWLLGRTTRSYLDPYRIAESALEVENISGACMMLRREAVEQVGLLDEAFFMYCEDMDYCIRLRKAGWKLFYLPKSEIIHLVGQSSGGRMRNYSLQAFQSLFHLYRRHYSVAARLSVRMVVLIMSSLRWLWNTLCGNVSSRADFHRNRHDLQQIIRLCFQYRAQD